MRHIGSVGCIGYTDIPSFRDTIASIKWIKEIMKNIVL